MAEQADDERETGRRLTPARVVTAVVVGAVVLVVLFLWVFPWLERNISNPTLQDAVLVPATALVRPRRSRST